MNEPGVNIDHSTVQRWVIKYTGMLEDAFRKKKKPVGKSWRMDETYIKVKGKWCYLYRGVDKENNTPDKITIDKSGSNKVAINAI